MTVSNLGSYGVTYMHAVLNLPETVLLGVGACELRPVLSQWRTASRQILLSLTFDHRIVDGGPAAAFLRDLCRAPRPLSSSTSGTINLNKRENLPWNTRAISISGLRIGRWSNVSNRWSISAFGASISGHGVDNPWRNLAAECRRLGVVISSVS